MNQVSPLIRWSLCFLLFSLPLEMPDKLVFELTTMAGAAFLLTTLLEPRVCYGRLPWALVWYAALVAVLVLSLTVQGSAYPAGMYLQEVFTGIVLLVLWILVFWAATNLFRQERIATAALWCLAVGCVLRAGLPLIGVGRTAYVEGLGGERVTAFGQGPNQSAQVLALGLIALIGLVFVQSRAGPRFRQLMWVAVGVVTIGLVETGSRGGLLMLTVGLAVLLNSRGSTRTRLRNTLVVVTALGLVAYTSFRSDLLRRRFEVAAEQGNLAGRERIFPLLVDMFVEKPWLGWGPITNKYEVAARLGDPEHDKRDAHNLLLELVTSSGILGTLPFLVGVWCCLRAAWTARAGPRGVVPLAMLLAVLAGNMSGNRLTGPLLWLVLAYAASSALLARGPAPPATLPRRLTRRMAPETLWTSREPA